MARDGMGFNRFIPDLVLDKAMMMGAIGVKWLNNLDNVILNAEKRWNINVGDAISGGTHAFVAKVNDQNNSKMLIKISLPDGLGSLDFKYQVNALLAADGHGYVKLYEHDLENRICLLEEFGEPLSELNCTSEEQMNIICATLKKSWVKPLQAELQDGAAVINWFKEFIDIMWIELKEPCSRGIINKAYTFLDSRLAKYNPDNSVLVHGDAHNGNILLDLEGNSFKLIDPDGIFCEKAYDLGVLMREWVDELLPDPCGTGVKRCAYLCRMTKADERAIWEWGFIQSVSTGLLCLKTGQTDQGKKLLRIADVWSVM